MTMLLTKQNEKLKKRLSNDKTTCVYREMHNCWRDLILPLCLSILSRVGNSIKVGTIKRSLSSNLNEQLFFKLLRILIRIQLVGIIKLTNDEIIRLYWKNTMSDIALLWKPVFFFKNHQVGQLLHVTVYQKWIQYIQKSGTV